MIGRALRQLDKVGRSAASACRRSLAVWRYPGIEIGRDVTIGAAVTLKATDGGRIVLGDRVSISNGAVLVAKRGRRAWTEGVDVYAALLGFDLTENDIFEKSIVSPSKVEALLGKKKFTGFVAATGALTQNSSGYDLVPATDKRPAVDTKQLEKEQLSGFTAISLDD